MTRILVLGDTLLDRDLTGDVTRVCPDAPAPVLDVRGRVERPGGAGLAALLLAGPGPTSGSSAGHAVQLVTCLGGDPDADRLRRLLTGRVELIELGRTEDTRTLTRVRSRGQSLVRIDEGDGAVRPDASLRLEALERALDACDAVLVADYGGGVAGHPGVRALLARWARRRPMVWDPHPRGLPPVSGVTVATPNRAETRAFATRAGLDPPGDGPATGEQALDVMAAALRDAWSVHAVAATDGAGGVFTALADSPPLFTPAPCVSAVDTCGAGDRFAGAVAAELATGGVITEAVARAVEDVAAWLARGGVGAVQTAEEAGHPEPQGEALAVDNVAVDTLAVNAETLARVEAIRAAGGRIVATGGCFDVVHAGHVASLRAARRLGDHLVVLLNSDQAVRRLKGPDRPVHDLADRLAVLRGLSVVDDVLVFDDDTPAAMLERLRPDVWAKGGDYAGATLPEAALVRGWGGRVVLLPYLPGRSTTRILLREATR
jgi:rfaE bifunctional protein nucleotidyltransferase chain/domain